MVSKIKKLNLSHFDAMNWVLRNGVEETPLQQFLLNSFYSFDSIFSIIVWIDQQHNCVEGIFLQCLTKKQKKKKLCHFSW